MKLLRFASFVSVLSLVACGGAAPPPPVATVKQPIVVKAPEPPQDPSLVSGSDWEMNLALPTMWNVKLRPASPSDVTSELVAQTKGDAPVAIGLEVVTGPTSGNSEIDFIKEVLGSEEDTGEIRHLKIFKAKIRSGQLAAGVIEMRKFDDGIALLFEVITARGDRGFVVRCGGSPDEAEKWESVCSDTLETFRLKTASTKVQRPAKSTARPPTSIQKTKQAF